MKNNKGFTLIELLVVIAIVGILAIVAVPALFKNINKAKMADLISDLNAMKTSATLFYAENNRLPETEDELFENMESVPQVPEFTHNSRVQKYQINFIRPHKLDGDGKETSEVDKSKDVYRIDVGFEASDKVISPNYFSDDKDLKQFKVAVTPPTNSIYGVWFMLDSEK
ncbi:type II secretion system protein [Paraclostridium bifermentans]|uniref:type II secretion system protein n=1 Tax=Paraclostridium bifermentans TaxID=1490 RepID=UPI00359C377F